MKSLPGRGSLFGWFILPGLLILLAHPLQSALLSDLHTGNAPSGVAVDSVTDTAVVANEKDNTVSLVDLAGKTVISTIPVGERPTGAAVNPRTGQAVVTNRKSDSISIIDLNTFTRPRQDAPPCGWG